MNKEKLPPITQRYTIDRSKWVCGTKEQLLGHTRMLNNIGRMCCLGQICKQMGYKDADLYSHELPSLVYEMSKKENYKIRVFLDDQNIDNIFSYNMAKINDEIHITQAEREKQLKRLAREQGILLTFKGRLMDGPLAEVEDMTDYPEIKLV